MTLIRSNPSFKQERTSFFYQRFNGRHKSLDEVAIIFRQIDLMCNAINEKTGRNIDAEEMYLMVICAMNDYDYSVREVDVDGLYADMEALLMDYLPMVYSPETPDVLAYLRQKEGHTLSLLSNTGFIKGSTLRKVLLRMGLDHFFDFQLYSDETGMSKPNLQLFQLMLDKVGKIRSGVPLQLSEILHVGDNVFADVEGAHGAGIRSLLINSNNRRIISLMNP